jgi:hypothetical protein
MDEVETWFQHIPANTGETIELIAGFVPVKHAKVERLEL